MFRDEYRWSECRDLILERATLLVHGSRHGTREDVFRNEWITGAPSTCRLIVDFDNLETCTATFARAGKHEQATGSIRTTLHPLLAQRDLLRSVVLDITSLQHAAMMYIVRILFDLAPGELFGVYAEPESYAMTAATEFRLTKEFLGDRPVPGFVRQTRPDVKTMVAFLGFEGERLGRILEDRQHISRVIPVLGVPSYLPGWNLHSLASAARVATSFDALPNMRSCAAFSVHEALSVLDAIAQDEDKNLVISPLGTRPHTLASAIFAARNRRVSLAYDHPVEAVSRAVGLGATHAYHLSCHLP